MELATLLIAISSFFISLDTRKRVLAVKNKNKSQVYVLDTSALIDGRLVDLFLSKPFGTPTIHLLSTVTRELNLLADGKDAYKRARARRGLERIVELQELYGTAIVNIEEKKSNELSADSSLIAYAKKQSAIIGTTDYALEQVALAQGIAVLNPNNISSIFKLNYMPGDLVKVTPIRNGEKQGQLIGYLQDGTLIVVDGCSKNDIGKQMTAECVKPIQTKSGKMVFARKLQVNH